jgi:methionyl-tRNA formyltransferase
MGSSFASAECLRAILREPSLEVTGVVTQPDRPAGRGKTLTACPCAQFAARRGIEQVIKPENVNSEESLATIRSWKPDVIAVVAFGQILKKPLLELPPFGCVNCHFSLLPKYRGAAPVIASLLSGDRLTGVTVMHMGEGLDDGPIMLQSYEPIYPDTTGGALMDDLAVAGGVALAKALKLLSSNQLPPEVPQDHENATYVKKLRKSDGIIDWNLPALEIERRIRAYCPWPGCYTFLPERMRRKGMTGRTAVLRARFAKLEPGWKDYPPGTVLKLDRQGPVVKCLDTALTLVELKPEGGKAMDGGAFLRGRQLLPLEDRFSVPASD